MNIKEGDMVLLHLEKGRLDREQDVLSDVRIICLD